MASPFPVYKEIAEMLNTNPEKARDIDLAQLRPLIQLSHSAPSVLLDAYALHQVEEIYLERQGTRAPAASASKKPVIPKLKLKAKLKAKEPKPLAQQQGDDQRPGIFKIKTVVKKKQPKTEPHKEAIAELNANHQKALEMTQESLRQILEWSDQVYYLPENADEPNMLRDEVYDYVKMLYNKRRLGTNDKAELLKSVSSQSGVGADALKPRRERDTKLPVALRSLDNLFKDDGDVEKWDNGYEGSYVLSAKMDGTSALYYRNKLYTRGNATMGRDITHVIPYLNLPEISDELAVRGEIVMRKNTFDNKYKGKKGSGSGAGAGVRKVNRNSVSGSLSSINNIDSKFLSDLTFAAYEVINMHAPIQLAPSRAFEMLKEKGFQTAWHKPVSNISDNSLSKEYLDLLDNYDFEIDGIVIQRDKPYRRETKKNPDYAKAFKQALGCDTAITSIVDIEWNPSQYGYLVPTAIYEPVVISGVTLERATLHNAREVVKKGLGPGAKVEVCYWGKVNPRIMATIEPVEPYLPQLPYEWVDNGKEPADIMLIDTTEDQELTRKIAVKRIYKFLVEIGAKGIGETTVEKIYNMGFKGIDDFINLTDPDKIAFLGPINSKKIVKSIQDAMHSITVPRLMAASKVFGRGLGTKKFAMLIDTNSDFVVTRLTRDEYITAFKKVDGFAQKTAEKAADGMDEYWDFVDNVIPSEIYESIIDNTIAAADTKSKKSSGHSDITGKKICLTGFRDQAISNFIESNGGTIQGGCNASTYILVRKDGYTNKKTDFAQSQGIRIMDRSEFIEEYKV